LPLGFVQIVSPATQFQICDNGQTAIGMMEFEESCFPAATLCPNEGAPAAIPRPDFPSDDSRDVP
jgi:hypothetical protein